MNVYYTALNTYMHTRPHDESGQKPARDYRFNFWCYTGAGTGTNVTVSSAQTTQYDKSVSSSDK